MPNNPGAPDAAADGILRTIESGLSMPPPAPSGRRSALAEQVAQLHQRWTVQPQPFSSGAPLVGPLIAAVRTLWNSISTKWYLAPILRQQNDFNATATRFAQHTEEDLRTLRILVESMDQRVADADRSAIETRRDMALGLMRLRENDATVEALAGRLESMDQRVADADRSAIETRRDMALGLMRLRENDAKVEALAERQAGADHDRVQLLREQAQLQVLLMQQRHRIDALEQQARERDGAMARRLDAFTGDVGVRLRRLEGRALDGAPVPLPPPVPAAPPRTDVPAIDYVRFEQRFRGPSEQVLEQQRRYLPLFAGASDVLDIGCGRGEFMELLLAQGVSCRGVDLDEGMVAACRERGLEAEYGDALALLRGLPDACLGGAFSAQVVEHLTPAQLTELIDLLGRKLRTGAPVVIETINPMSLIAASTHFLLDLSHTRLVHPETLRFLLDCAGFGAFELLPSSPVPDEVRLEHLPRFSDAGLRDEWMDAMNRNLDRLNSFLYGYQDYALAARRLDGDEAAE